MDNGFDGLDTNQLEKIMSVVRIVKGLSDMEDAADIHNAGTDTAHTTAENTNENTGKTTNEGVGGADIFDTAGTISVSNETQAINALNAAVPYLDFKYRKPIGIFVKIMEMNKIITGFEAVSAGIEDSRKSKERKKRMLLAIRPELDAKKQHVLDIFVRVLEIKDIMEVMSIDAKN